MIQHRAHLALPVALTLLAGCGIAPSLTPAPSAAARATAVVPGQIVVKLRNTYALPAWASSAGLRVDRAIPGLSAVVVRAADTKSAIARLERDPGVVYAEPNYLMRKIDTPKAPSLGVLAGDELLDQLWGMQKIGANQVLASLPGDRKVTVAVIDSGVDYSHPDLAGRTSKGNDFVNFDQDAMDDDGHGTHCAGTIAGGLGDGGVVGVAPGVSILPVKVLDANGSGSFANVASGIVYAADQGAPILSMSLGAGRSSKVLDDAVAYALGKGALIVAAAGNDGSEEPSYPAVMPGVMAVSATMKNDKLALFSNIGKHISVAAPGTDILSTFPGGKYESLDGTSMACPHVAGLAALVKSKNPGFTAKQIRSKIESAAFDLGPKGFDPTFGFGRIDAVKAIR